MAEPDPRSWRRRLGLDRGAGAAAIGGALWTVRPSLTFLVATALGGDGTLWAAFSLPSRPPSLQEETS